MTELAILRMFDAYKAAAFAKDVDAFIALYDPEVRVFDMWGRWSYDGVDAWRRTVVDWFGSLGTERVVVDWHEVQSIVVQDVAVAHAFVTYKGASAQGGDLRAMHNRLTWALRQKGGAWRIVHEHTSAPADFETSKVMLQRAVTT
jgi:uncharacterized protein (TIGR02246 family)